MQGRSFFILILLHQHNHHGLLGVEAVFRFFEDFVCVGFKDICRYFFASVGGQAVLHHAVGSGHGHEFFVDLIYTLKGGAALFLLAFLAHRGPNIGENNIRICCGLFGVAN